MTTTSLLGPRLSGSLNSLAFAFAPRLMTRLREKQFGHTYVIRGIHGDALCTTDPEHARRVFSSDPDAFRTLAEIALPELFGKRSVLVNSGATHRRQRKLLAPPLHGPRLRAFGSTMQEIADRQLDRLSPGQSLRALDFTTAYTMDVIVRTVFGATDEAEAAPLRALLQELVHAIPPSALFVPRLQRDWYPPWKRYVDARTRFRDWTSDKIRAVKRAGTEGTDVLSLLLAARYDDGSEMDEEEVRDQLVTLLLAGHETTAIALANCLSRLALHPAEAARVQAELASGEDVLHARYLAAFIDETLRIDPIVTDLARVASADFPLDERVTVRAGQTLFLLLEGIQLDPTLYPEPLRFRPERFLERKYMQHEYTPFGGGARRCIGAAFSDYETKIMLGTLLRRVTYTLTRGKRDARVRRNLTMGPRHGVPIRIESVLPPSGR